MDATQTLPAKGADEKFCADCGAVIKVKAEICPKCGCRQSHAPTGEGHSRMVAALLAIFLGGVGAHKFYLGKSGQGILYLVFCWTMLPAIIGLIEGLNFLLMSDKVFNQRHNA